MLVRAALDPATSREATRALAAMERTENFTLALLSLCQQLDCQQSAALYFKNSIKRYWVYEESAIPDADRDQIKRTIVDVALATPVATQTQLCEAISFIAESDFPDKWDSLINTLVSKLSATDWNINNGVLLICHSVFKRWRGQFRSDSLFLEIKMVLGQFCPAYLTLIRAVDRDVQSSMGNPTMLNLLIRNVLLLCKIYYSLICQDLPEFLEDNQQEFMGFLRRYLEFQAPGIQDDNLEKMKTVICEIIEDFAKRYEEVFPQLPDFVSSAWVLLTTTSLEQSNDMVCIVDSKLYISLLVKR